MVKAWFLFIILGKKLKHPKQKKIDQNLWDSFEIYWSQHCPNWSRAVSVLNITHETGPTKYPNIFGCPRIEWKHNQRLGLRKSHKYEYKKLLWVIVLKFLNIWIFMLLTNLQNKQNNYHLKHMYLPQRAQSHKEPKIFVRVWKCCNVLWLLLYGIFNRPGVARAVLQ